MRPITTTCSTRARAADPEDQLHVTNAYVDLTDGKHDWQARVGPPIAVRQRHRRPFRRRARRVPVAPRHRAESWRSAIPSIIRARPSTRSRRFVGLSADLDQLVRALGLQFLRHPAERRRHRRSRGRRRRSALPQRSLARRRRDRCGLVVRGTELGARQCDLARDGQVDAERALQRGRRAVHRDAQRAARPIVRDRSTAMLDTYTEAQLRTHRA